MNLFLRRLPLQPAYLPLTVADLETIYKTRQGSFSSWYWERWIADDHHYRIVTRTKTPLDCRLLYDSWLWRNLLQDHAQPRSHSVIAELLPGSSLTIPVALESVHYTGDLYQINDEPPAKVPKWFHFKTSRLPGKVHAIASQSLGPCMIVGNHIVDDLLFDLYCVGLKDKQRRYNDVTLCRDTWSALSQPDTLLPLQTALCAVFAELATNLSPPSAVLLRHYPSTFALESNDLARINAEMSTFHEIARTLSACDDCATYMIDISDVKLPAGSLYPNSILMTERQLSGQKRNTFPASNGERRSKAEILGHRRQLSSDS